MKRQIIQIDENKCDGCGLCIPDCPEGALQMIDGKARLISDLFCDGLGACIGSCPKGAIRVIKREAKPYDEKEVMKNIIKQGKNTIIAHLKHLQDHGETRHLNTAIDFLRSKNIDVDFSGEKKKPLPCGCPGSALKDFKRSESRPATIRSGKDPGEDLPAKKSAAKLGSELRQWPVQLALLPPHASFFDNADLLVAADCVAYANPNFHSQLLKGKSLCIGCPKLDDIESYEEKLTQIFRQNEIRSITAAIMQVPCCGGLSMAVQNAIENSGKNIKFEEVVIGVDGQPIK